VIGVTCSATCLSPEALQTISLCRRLSPEAKIVAGGSHFTLMAEPILKEIADLDYVVLGEGEIAFLKLLQNLSEGKNGKGVRGIALREDGKVVLQERVPLFPNIDSLPLAAYHLVDMESEAYYWHGMERGPLGSPPAGLWRSLCLLFGDEILEGFGEAKWKESSGGNFLSPAPLRKDPLCF